MRPRSAGPGWGAAVWVILPLAAVYAAGGATNDVAPREPAPAISNPTPGAATGPALPGKAGKRHPSKEEVLALVDRVHDRISSNIVLHVARIDRFFGADQVRDETRSTYIQAGVGFRWKRHEGGNNQGRVAPAGLPALRETGRGDGRKV